MEDRASHEVELWGRRDRRARERTTNVGSRLYEGHADIVVGACHSGMANRRRWGPIASQSTDKRRKHLRSQSPGRNRTYEFSASFARTDGSAIAELGRQDRPVGSRGRRARATAGARRRDQGLPRGARPGGLGFPVAAVVRIRPSPGQLQRIPEIARETPEVGECHRITGEDCYLLRIHLRSIDDLEEILDRFTPHGLTTTSIIHSTPVPRRGAPLSA